MQSVNVAAPQNTKHPFKTYLVVQDDFNTGPFDHKCNILVSCVINKTSATQPHIKRRKCTIYNNNPRSPLNNMREQQCAHYETM